MSYPTLFSSRRIRFILAAISCWALIGCSVGPKYKPPTFAAPPAFKETPPQQSPDGTLWKEAKPMDEASRGRWWEIYEEPELNGLEDRLNHSNQTIVQSYQNYMAARALVRQARSNLYPTVPSRTRYTNACVPLC